MHCDKMHHTRPKGHLLHCVMVTNSYSTCITCSVHGVEFSLPIYTITLNLDIAKICCKKTELHNLHSMFGPCFCIDVGPIKLSQY